ncbi:MAG TPA: phage/plasmid primase, P4 family [Pirellulales bacterium]|nr:phage/plasmid primase, P4 family [Pirellulales bacterium]
MREHAELRAAIKWWQYTASAPGIRAMLDLAKPDLAVSPAQFDQDPWLFNCPNGTVDLRTGELREHRRHDYITKLCPTEYEPAAACPTWLAFLDTIFGDENLIGYVQRLCGYWLTGDVREQILPIAWGTGSNGKSTLVNAIMEAFGRDYAIKVDKAVIVAKDREGHSTERMDLYGVRLGVVTETDDGQRFAEAAVKELTGGDVIRGRRMRQDTWEYRPTHKLLLVTNHKPRVKSIDHAFWRRVKLIEFGVTIPDDKQDKTLPERLKAEYSGILNWAIRGCLRWQRYGLGEPESVRNATAQYRAAEDIIAQFIADRCETGAVRAKKSEAYREYQEWCKTNGFHPATSTKFTQTLGEHGYPLDPCRRWYEGIGLCVETA